MAGDIDSLKPHAILLLVKHGGVQMGISITDIIVFCWMATIEVGIMYDKIVKLFFHIKIIIMKVLFLDGNHVITNEFQ